MAVARFSFPLCGCWQSAASRRRQESAAVRRAALGCAMNAACGWTSALGAAYVLLRLGRVHRRREKAVGAVEAVLFASSHTLAVVGVLVDRASALAFLLPLLLFYVGVLQDARYRPVRTGAFDLLVRIPANMAAAVVLLVARKELLYSTSHGLAVVLAVTFWLIGFHLVFPFLRHALWSRAVRSAPPTSTSSHPRAR